MKVNERSLVEGLSYALDVAEKSYFSHSKHVAYMSVMLAKELKLSEDEQKDVYFAALLHDIGTGNANGLLEHCRIGSAIVLKLPIDNKIAGYIYFHHEFFDGTGAFGLIGDDIPILAQIICLADFFDVNFRCLQDFSFKEHEKINEWIKENEAKFNSKLLDAFCRLIEKEFILLDYYNSEFNNILINKVKVIGVELEYEGIKAYAKAFSEIIDTRSAFTFRHSMGIANLVNKITDGLGYDVETQNKMYISALLHDIGKLVIPNEILDKEGKLDPDERFEINKHTYYSRWILQQIDGFEEITNFASNHHEKLNGKGYPLKLDGSELGELERVMAICDIFQALTEDRPYRTTMPIDKVWSIIDTMVEKGELDGELVGKIKIILNDDYN